MTHLIVLSGEAGAGKDSVAKILVEVHGWVLYPISAPLKRFGEDMFGFSHDQCHGPSRYRNEPDPRWARPCTACDEDGNARLMACYGKRTCLACAGTKVINDNSPRRVFQLLGDEYLRQMIHPDALTLRARPELELLLARGQWVVVNDARFSNDRDNLHAWLGGHRVDIRTPLKKSDGAPWRQHGSELDRPTDDNVEYVLVNLEDYPFPSLSSRVSQMLQALFNT